MLRTALFRQRHFLSRRASALILFHPYSGDPGSRGTTSTGDETAVEYHGPGGVFRITPDTDFDNIDWNEFESMMGIANVEEKEDTGEPVRKESDNESGEILDYELNLETGKSKFSGKTFDTSSFDATSDPNPGDVKDFEEWVGSFSTESRESRNIEKAEGSETFDNEMLKENRASNPQADIKDKRRDEDQGTSGIFGALLMDKNTRGSNLDAGGWERDKAMERTVRRRERCRHSSLKAPKTRLRSKERNPRLERRAARLQSEIERLTAEFWESYVAIPGCVSYIDQVVLSTDLQDVKITWTLQKQEHHPRDLESWVRKVSKCLRGFLGSRLHIKYIPRVHLERVSLSEIDDENSLPLRSSSQSGAIPSRLEAIFKQIENERITSRVC